jgi:crossover junction endodeoxyribonuclease RusA
VRFNLPFPPSSLSGHNNGAWYNRDKIVATYRAEAFHLTRMEMRAQQYAPPETGDIALSLRFVPPDNRGDRTNFAGRMKAQIDGIAEALGVNDKRFLPSYAFAAPEKAGRVEVSLG